MMARHDAPRIHARVYLFLKPEVFVNLYSNARVGKPLSRQAPDVYSTAEHIAFLDGKERVANNLLVGPQARYACTAKHCRPFVVQHWSPKIWHSDTKH